MAVKAKKAMIVSVGTGKEGKDIAHGICFSIHQQNPDLLLFLNTEESRKTTMPFIIEDCKFKGRQWKEFSLSDADDVEKITLECQNVIHGLINEGYDPANMVVDYTSGTKAMSAGVTIASIRERMGTLTYISGKRGEGGRVITGTERTLSISPNQIVADDLFKEAIESFNTFHFDVSLRIVEEAKTLLLDPAFLAKLQILEILSKAYGSWDRFEIVDAFELLKTLRQPAITEEWGIQKQIDLNKQALYQEKEKLFCAERLFDLLENAIRRGDEERKFDDAVARLYRVCEFVAQLELSELGLYKIKDGKPDVSDLDLSNPKLSTTLQEKYSRYTDSRDGKVKLHLSGDYSLLYDLSHPAGVLFKERESQFKKLLGLRDLSILAHGFNPISEQGYREMIELIEAFVEAVKLGGAKVRDRVKFPRIRVNPL